MQYKRFKLSVILFLGLGLSGLRAQEVIPASGGNASDGSGSVSYTIGQVAYHTLTGTNGSVAEGVQQAYEISVISGSKEEKEMTLMVTAYPNPAGDLLVLTVANDDLQGYAFHLYDVKGTLLQNEIITNSQTGIGFADLVPSIYFVKVLKNQKEIKTFKIIKKH